MATKQALKKGDVQLQCSICCNTLKQPKLLPCLHLFCKSPCLEKLVAKDGRSLTCPTCKQVVPLSKKGLAEFQPGFHIDRLLENRNALNKTAKPTETICGNCEAAKATGYCTDCEEFFCDECQIAHKKIKKMKNHRIHTLGKLQTQAANFTTQTKSTPINCPKHPENTLKIYCETCSTLICNDCIIHLHRDHDYVLVAEVFQKHKEELVSILKPVKQKLDMVRNALQTFDVRAKEINDEKAVLETHIQKEIDNLHKLLDQRKAQLVSELNILTQQKLKSLAAQRDQVEITQVKFTSCLEYAEGGLQTGTEGEVLAMKAPVLKRIEQISAEFDPDTIQPETEADLQIEANSKEQIQQCCSQYLTITDFSLKDSKTTGDGLKGAATGEQKTVMFHALTKLNKEYKEKIAIKAELECIKNKSRTRCPVVNQPNGQYKIVYRPVKRKKHQLHLTVNGNPVQGSPFPIAVTPSLQSLSKPVLVVRGLDHPRGTAINSKGRMIVVEGDGSCVTVLTPEGEKIRTFSSKGSRNGQLWNAWGVTVDKEDNIYVADSGNNRIQKFTSQGEFVTTVGNYKSPIGICYNLKDNNLYVADQSNHRIQVITTDLRFVRRFGTQGSKSGQLQFPIGVAFDSAHNLYVTENANDRVQVLTTDGHFLRAFSEKANGEKLTNPWDIAIDSSNTVYVSEKASRSYCVSMFTYRGDYITTFGGKGQSRGQFQLNGIYGLSIDSNDSVIVSDSSNGQLQIY